MTNEFNLDALHKAYETGFLSREDFGTDEEWSVAIDIFSSQMNEELEIPQVQEANDHTNPNNWGLSPLRDASLRRQMAQDPDWDAKQLSTPLDPEIDAMINEFNCNGSEELDDINPYDEFETIDDTEYPLAHGQLLPHLAGKVSPDVIFQLGQGNFDALENIEDDLTRTWAQNRMEVLGNNGAWGEDWNLQNDKTNDFDPFADTWGDGTY